MWTVNFVNIIVKKRWIEKVDYYYWEDHKKSICTNQSEKMNFRKDVWWNYCKLQDNKMNNLNRFKTCFFVVFVRAENFDNCKINANNSYNIVL